MHYSCSEIHKITSEMFYVIFQTGILKTKIKSSYCLPMPHISPLLFSEVLHSSKKKENSIGKCQEINHGSQIFESKCENLESLLKEKCLLY